jgi:threonine synthase
MSSRLVCFNPSCRAEYASTEVLYACTRCDGLLEAKIDYDRTAAAGWKQLWRQRRLSNAPLDVSGVWRYREMLDLFDGFEHVVTLREGNTPLLASTKAAAYAGLDNVVLQASGLQPDG